MINTTNPGHSAPSLLSATNTALHSDRSDHVSILSDLANGTAEPGSVSSAFRPRWIWLLIAASLGGGMAIFGVMRGPESGFERNAVSVPMPVAKVSPSPRAALNPPAGDRVGDESQAPAAAVIRDSSRAGVSVVQAPIKVSEEAATLAVSNATVDSAKLADPRAVTARSVKPATTSKDKSVRTKQGGATERVTQRTVDSDVDIITAIVKHAETSLAR